MTEPKRTRLTDMEFDEISFVDNPAHPDAKVVLFKRYAEDLGQVDKALHGATGPTSSSVHVDRISSHNKPKKKKKRSKQTVIEDLMVEKHRADHDEKTHGNRPNARGRLAQALLHPAVIEARESRRLADKTLRADARKKFDAAKAAKAEKKRLSLERRRIGREKKAERRTTSGFVAVSEFLAGDIARADRGQNTSSRSVSRTPAEQAQVADRLERQIRSQNVGRDPALIQRRVDRMRRATLGGSLVRKEQNEVEKRTEGIRRALKALGARKKSNKKRIAQGKKPIVAGQQVSAASLKKEEAMDDLYEEIHKFDDDEVEKGLVTAGAPGLDLNRLWEYANGGEKPKKGVSSGGEVTDGGRKAGSRGRPSPGSDGSPTSASVVPSRLNETMAVGNPGTATPDSFIREGRSKPQGDPKKGTVSTQELMAQWGLAKVYAEANAVGGGG